MLPVLRLNFRLNSSYPQPSDSFESLPLCRNVYILVSFHPAGSEGFEVRSHFTPVTSVSVSLQAVSQLHYAKDNIHCLSAISYLCFILFLSPPGLGHYIWSRIKFLHHQNPQMSEK